MALRQLAVASAILALSGAGCGDGAEKSHADATATGITHNLGRMQLWDGTMMELPQFEVRF